MKVAFTSAARSPFTLIEIMVVIAIMVLALSVVAVRIRDGSPTVVFDNRLRDFERFILKVRTRAVELGRDFELTYEESESAFRAQPVKLSESGNSQLSTDEEPINEWCAPDDLMLRARSQEYTELAQDESGEAPTPLTWSLPPDWSVQFPETQAGFSFRFRSDGGGAGEGELRFAAKSRQAGYRISSVTGGMRRLSEKELEQ